MTQLQAFSGTAFGDVYVPAAIPCPVPDWENGVIRAYSQEEQRTIRHWYVEQGLVKPLEEIISSKKPKRTSIPPDNEPPLTDEEFNDFMETLAENRRIDREMGIKRTARLMKIMGGNEK
ncbi:MAG: hypothetical protein LBT46_11570 [Planctomycetaceae bacterium]|jgi:hypothetical protein|nr:hypothetical protein [Planctomycetaceae bacterium]